MFKVTYKPATLKDLVEFQNDPGHSIYPVPWGKLEDLNKIVIKRAVPWKMVKGEAYKKIKTKSGKNLYEVQQTAADVVRKAAAEKVGVTYTRGMRNKVKGVAVVKYADGSIGIVPEWAALLGESGKKGTIEQIIASGFNSKMQALKYIRTHFASELEKAHPITV